MSYSVLFRQFPLDHLDTLAPVVRQAYGVTDYDARSKIRKGWGFLERNVDEETAQRLVGWLGERVVVIENSKLRELPDPQTIREVKFPEDVAVVAAGGFTEDVVRRDTGGDFKTGQMLMGLGVFMVTGMPMGLLGQKKEEAKPVKSKRLITFGSVITQRGEQFAFSPDNFDFSGLGAQKQLNTVANFRAFIARLQQPGARLNLGAQFMLANKSLTLANYQGLQDYETELLWLFNTT